MISATAITLALAFWAPQNGGQPVCPAGVQISAQVPADAKAAFLNVTTTNSGGTGFVTVYPCGSTQPLASSSNTAAGETRATLVAAKIGRTRCFTPS